MRYQVGDCVSWKGVNSILSGTIESTNEESNAYLVKINNSHKFVILAEQSIIKNE